MIAVFPMIITNRLHKKMNTSYGGGLDKFIKRGLVKNML